LLKEDEFREFLEENGWTSEGIEGAVRTVEAVFHYFDSQGIEFEEAQVGNFKRYISKMMERDENTEDALLGLGRYVYFLNMKDVWIYFASILGGRNILPSISERLEEIAGREVRDEVFREVEFPSLGSPPSAYVESTHRLMQQLRKHLSPEVYRRVLAGNHHRVPLENFEKYKRWLEEEGDIDAWLERMHRGMVEELERYMREGRVWYEQVITPEVLEYVKGNQELLAGIRRGEWIYNAKFPYSPNRYLSEKDPLMKRYYMCHCPMAREAILEGDPEIPMDWCYCSAGYGKLRYDVTFGTETEVEVLESVFQGSDKCRFRIKIPEKILEKYLN
jgi:hypothetical protein